MREAEEIRNAQPGKLPPKLKATDAKPFQVKKRTTGDIIDFAIFRNGDKLAYEVLDTEGEAMTVCESLNTPSAACIMPLHIDPQSDAQPAA